LIKRYYFYRTLEAPQSAPPLIRAAFGLDIFEKRAVLTGSTRPASASAHFDHRLTAPGEIEPVSLATVVAYRIDLSPDVAGRRVATSPGYVKIRYHLSWMECWRRRLSFRVKKNVNWCAKRN
jgi:hypothetical protein